MHDDAFEWSKNCFLELLIPVQEVFEIPFHRQLVWCCNDCASKWILFFEIAETNLLPVANRWVFLGETGRFKMPIVDERTPNMNRCLGGKAAVCLDAVDIETVAGFGRSNVLKWALAKLIFCVIK